MMAEPRQAVFSDSSGEGELHGKYMLGMVQRYRFEPRERERMVPI